MPRNGSIGAGSSPRRDIQSIVFFIRGEIEPLYSGNGNESSAFGERPLQRHDGVRQPPLRFQIPVVERRRIVGEIDPHGFRTGLVHQIRSRSREPPVVAPASHATREHDNSNPFAHPVVSPFPSRSARQRRH